MNEYWNKIRKILGHSSKEWKHLKVKWINRYALWDVIIFFHKVPHNKKETYLITRVYTYVKASGGLLHNFVLIL